MCVWHAGRNSRSGKGEGTGWKGKRNEKGGERGKQMRGKGCVVVRITVGRVELQHAADETETINCCNTKRIRYVWGAAGAVDVGVLHVMIAPGLPGSLTLDTVLLPVSFGFVPALMALDPPASHGSSTMAL